MVFASKRQFVQPLIDAWLKEPHENSDLVIIFGYLIGIVLFGSWFAQKATDNHRLLPGDRSVPWWAVAFSIVATETSTITFISVPGIAFARGGNFNFCNWSLVIWRAES